MAPTTPTKPLSEPGLWRRLLARCHPDSGGDDALFVWATALREHVLKAADRSAAVEARRSHAQSADRIPFTPNAAPGHFDRLTEKALAASQAYSRSVGEPYASALLGLLEDCWEEFNGQALRSQNQGATYKALAFAAHQVGMTGPQRQRWYSVAEDLNLTQRHIDHILSRAKSGRLRQQRRAA